MSQLSIVDAEAGNIDAFCRHARESDSPHAAAQPQECLLVAVSSSPRADRLVLRAAELAANGRHWIAVHVETATDARMNSSEHATLARNLSLAERLGAETAILQAVDPVAELLNFARRHGVTRILVGKPRHPWWWGAWIGRISVDDLTRRSEQIDIHVLSDLESTATVAPSSAGPDRRQFLAYFWAAAVMGLATLVNFYCVQPHLKLRNVVMVYLLGVIITALQFGRGPSAFATIISVMAFDVIFVDPVGSLGPVAPQDIITFCVMLVVGFTISTLTGHVRFQVQAARHREQRMSALFAMSRDFAELRSQAEIAAAAERHIGNAIGAETFVWLPARDDGSRGGVPHSDPADGDGRIFEWVQHHNLRAGAGTEKHPNIAATYLPLAAAHGCVGVVRIRLQSRDEFLSPERHDLLQTLTSLTALAIERASSVAAAERARLDTEAERLRNALLSAISHDLRTPLAAIMGSSSALVDLGERLEPATRLELAESILDEGERLNRQVANLLEMTRLENGSIRVHKEWQPLDEVAGVVLDRLKRLLKGRPVQTNLPLDLPPVPMDDGLVQQVLVNLLENAAKYAPAGTPIELSAWREENAVIMEVADRGSGMPPEFLGRAFDRFFRSPSVLNGSGVGLGLAICKGIVSLHGGRIWAENRPDRGLSVRFSLPIPPDEHSLTEDAAAR